MINEDPNSILVTVVVPTHFSAAYLERCLISITKQTYRNIELLVVDHASTDGTQEIAKKYTDKCFFNQAIERSEKRNFGALQAQGQYVFIADSDMIFSPNVIESCLKVVLANPSIKGVVVPEHSIGTSFWGHCKALERSFYVGVDWMEAARFFRRDTFIEAGGYDITNTGSEDYDLPQRIAQKFGEKCIGRINDIIVQNEVDLSLYKTCAKKFYYAKSFPKYQKNPANSEKFNKQSSLLRRYLLFLSQPNKLFKNPLLGVGMLFMKTTEFFAGGMGYLLAKMRYSGSLSEQS